MQLTATPTELSKILPFRQQFLQETNFQIRYDAVHVRNWSDSYSLAVDGIPVGYGSVMGKDDLSNRDAVFEFYVVPTFRKKASDLFGTLLAVSRVPFIECQSNDFLLSSMMFEFATDIKANVILFADHQVTNYVIPEVEFRLYKDGDHVFGKKAKDIGAYVLEEKGEIVATGDFLLHYNKPFADLFMEVKEGMRNRGLGRLILQELKRECYLAGRVPAARCNLTNLASKATLQGAGFKICGYMLAGKVKNRNDG